MTTTTMSKAETRVAQMSSHYMLTSGAWVRLEIDHGRKYDKIVAVLSNGQRSAEEFVDRETGRVYRADGWNQRGRQIATV